MELFIAISFIFSLQVELSCKLVQMKLLHRADGPNRNLKTASLLEMSLAGSMSMDVSESDWYIKRVAWVVHNPSFSFSDGIFLKKLNV